MTSTVHGTCLCLVCISECFCAVSAKDSPVTDQTRSFYSRCGSTLEDVLMLHLQQTYNSSLRHVVNALSSWALTECLVSFKWCWLILLLQVCALHLSRQSCYVWSDDKTERKRFFLSYMSMSSDIGDGWISAYTAYDISKCPIQQVSWIMCYHPWEKQKGLYTGDKLRVFVFNKFCKLAVMISGV